MRLQRRSRHPLPAIPCTSRPPPLARGSCQLAFAHHIHISHDPSHHKQIPTAPQHSTTPRHSPSHSTRHTRTFVQAPSSKHKSPHTSCTRASLRREGGHIAPDLSYPAHVPPPTRPCPVSGFPSPKSQHTPLGLGDGSGALLHAIRPPAGHPGHRAHGSSRGVQRSSARAVRRTTQGGAGTVHPYTMHLRNTHLTALRCIHF
jgi:hypothetical protein